MTDTCTCPRWPFTNDPACPRHSTVREDVTHADGPTLADAWEQGAAAGEAYANARWQWSAGSVSRAMNGLDVHHLPERAPNPYAPPDGDGPGHYPKYALHEGPGDTGAIIWTEEEGTDDA